MTKEEFEFVKYANRIFGGNNNGIIGDLGIGLSPIFIVPLFSCFIIFLFLVKNFLVVAHLYCLRIFLTPRHSLDLSCHY